MRIEGELQPSRFDGLLISQGVVFTFRLYHRDC
jgi:hypothetical protein